MNKMKIGKIKISKTLYEESYSEIKHLFARVMPLHIDSTSEYRTFIFTCKSDEFDEISEAEAIPFYDVIFCNDLDGRKITIKREE